jgi:processive 1,2-diacylglycerol beta-glucosyltransferase
MPKKILIFYVSPFSGHHKAAQALEEAVRLSAPSAEVNVINAFEYLNPILGRVITKTTLGMIKKTPALWGKIYDNPAVMEKLKKTREKLHNHNMPKLRKLLDEFTPDAVYCTQALPCGLVAEYKKQTGSDLTLIGVLTDYAPHSYWIFDEVDHFIVPSEETARVLSERGINIDKMKICGIPVSPVFAERKNKDHIMNELGLSSEYPVILVMGGSRGMGAIRDIVRSVVKDPYNKYQFIVVTGKNRRLYNSLKKINDNKIKIVSYADNIDELMEVSELIITKPGGITTAEAIAKGLPMILIDPIPGQERFNADYFSKNGAAVEIKDLSKIHDVIEDICGNKEKFMKMVENVRRIAKPDAAMKAAAITLKE